MTDFDLLSSYCASRSQSAFTELVRRHISTVYSAARRQTNDLASADDITQAVFIILAGKANTISPSTPLPAWLLKTTHFACLDHRKRCLRRQRHEQAAALLAAQREPTMTHAALADYRADHPADLNEELDAALAALSDSDRGVITLRYFTNLSVADTAARLELTPSAAAKRIARALDRLRRCLRRRGVMVPAAGLAVALDHLPVLSPTPALAASVASAAISTSAPASAAIAKGTLHMMTWLKFKLAASVLAAVSVLTATTTVTIALLQQPPAPPDAPSAAPAANPNAIPAGPIVSPSKSGFIATLKNGVSVELLGVNENPSNGKPWWKADGSPLRKPPYSRFDGNITGSDGLPREFAVRIHRTVDHSTDSADVRWSVTNSSGSSSSDLYPPVKNVEATAFIVADDPDGVTLRATIAAGPWTTIHNFNGIYAQSSSESGLTGAHSYMTTGVLTDKKKIRVVIGCSGLSDSPQIQLVVIDKSGARHPATVDSSVGDNNMRLATFETDVPPDSVDSWDLQSRPYDQWIEIRHVALHPDQHTDARVVTSDGG